jgi:hypothetical protein
MDVSTPVRPVWAAAAGIVTYVLFILFFCLGNLQVLI